MRLYGRALRCLAVAATVTAVASGPPTIVHAAGGAVMAPPGRAEIVTFADRCLDVPRGSDKSVTIIQYDCDPSKKHQTFNFVPAGGGKYYIQTTHLPYATCLDVANKGQGDDVPIIQYSCTRGENQKFQVIRADSGRVYIKTFAGSDKCLDVEHASVENGARIVQFWCKPSENENQKFHLV